MDTPLSQRARAYVEAHTHSAAAPKGADASVPYGERQYADGGLVWWAGHGECLNFCYSGDWDAAHVALWEAAAHLMKGRPWAKCAELTPREIEFFLRDRNSAPAVPALALEAFGERWRELLEALAAWTRAGRVLGAYRFPSDESFARLALPDKIRELKAFFLSEKLAPFFARGGKLELVDVDGTTVFIALDTVDVPRGAFLDWLQMLAAEEFREPSLNLVPEEFPS
jgi:hypothetical protein